MAGLVADRVKETTSTTGTGNLTLNGAVSGFRTFDTALGLNTFFYYCVVSISGSIWEVGRGYLSGSTTLVRSVVLASSNEGSAVDLPSGTHTVFCTLAADVIKDMQGKALATSTGMNLP